MYYTPKFPTILHQETATLVKNFFSAIRSVDTILVVNSCARGHAAPESDLDFAVLVKSETTNIEIKNIETDWLDYSLNQPTIKEYKSSNQFAHIHLDIINGIYTPSKIEIGEPINYFELEIGNQICYSAPMNNSGSYFKELHNKWLPYYNEELRTQRLSMIISACEYDLNHIPYFINRGLYFQAFDILYKSFKEYLQALFIYYKTYPIAYNKWIKYQVVNLINKPDLYPKLAPILSVSNIESNEINDKAKMIRELLIDLKTD